MRHMKWWGWGEDGFCITRPGWSSEQASDLDECIGNSVRDPRASPSVRYPLPQSNGYGIWAARQLQACVSWPLAKGAS